MKLIVLAVVASAVLFVPAAHSASGETCQGKPATIVQSEGIVEGTDGDDVIVAGAAARVRADKGDDTVCGGFRVQGGPGVDSVQMRADERSTRVFLVDIERVDVDAGPGDDVFDVHWSDGRAEHVLKGRLDGGDGDDFIFVSGSRDVSAVLARERLRLSPGGFADLRGFEDVFVAAWRRARVVGDDGDNRLGAGGCFAYAAGGPGDDDIQSRTYVARDGCHGLRARGQDGDDILRGSDLDDVLDGGAGSDLAFGKRGVNQCPRVEQTRGCV